MLTAFTGYKINIFRGKYSEIIYGVPKSAAQNPIETIMARVYDNKNMYKFLHASLPRIPSGKQIEA